MGKLTDKVAKGVFWVMLEKCGVQFVHFLVALVLARLLTPNDYGTVALMSVFVSVSDLLVDCGIGSALVRKKNATTVDFNTVFYVNFLLALLLYVLLFFGAPFVADFYAIPVLTPMMRVLALKVVFQGLNEIQTCVMNKKMLFKLSFRISWTQAIVSAVTGISLAFSGFGPWALVWSSVIGGFVGMCSRLLLVRWRPSWSFSWRSAKEMLSFGWKMSAARMSTTVFNNLVGLCIGKLYTPADLSYMQKGGHLPKLAIEVVRRSVGKPAFSAMVRIQDDLPRLRQAMRRMLRLTSFLVFPISTGCAVLAEPLVLVLFGERWLPAVPFMRLTAMAVSFRTFDQVNYASLTARGFSGVYLKLILFRRLLGLAVLIATLRLGVLEFCFFQALIMGPVGAVVNSLPNRSLLGYTFEMQLKDVLPAVGYSLTMAVGIFLLGRIPADPRWLLGPQIAFGALLYVGCALVFRNRSLAEALGVLASVLSSRAPVASRTIASFRRRFWE